MVPIYTSHFRLSEAPFNITPDPSFLYLSASHREGLAQLIYGINARRGFIVLTGEVGTGKTTLLQALLRQLTDGTQTALIFSTITSSTDLFRYVCEEFKLVEPMQGLKDAHDYIYLLNEFLLQKYRDGENAALIIDEAQNLSAEVLESIRLLSNFETTKDKLLQILLVGQPELTERLNTPQLRQLKQRVTLRHHLRPLSLSECHEYIANRLKLVGGDPKIFLPNTVTEVHGFSGGIPRLINVICDNAMINAYALGRKDIEPVLIHEVAADLHLSAAASRSFNVRGGDGASKFETRPPLRVEPTKPQPLPAAKSHSTSSILERSNGASVNEFVPETFFAALGEGLVDAMGPMARVVLSEHVKLFGASADRFPLDKIGTLIDSVSREIFNESIRERFRRAMFEGIKRIQQVH
jgi:type II secretory pathway predicted ATPase ExeA